MSSTTATARLAVLIAVFVAASAQPTCLPGMVDGGLGNCTIVRPGSYSTGGLGALALACPAGTFLPTPGGASVLACLPCPAGTVSQTSGANVSTVCTAVSAAPPSPPSVLS
jgi:hypothetical protein